MICYKALNERICYIRLRGRFNKLPVISYNAPTEDSNDEDKDNFYGQLEELFISDYDTLMMLDANAKIGREDIWSSVAGKESLHEINNKNGVRILSFACSTNLFVASTKFPRKNINKHAWLWVSQDGQTINQIDHVLVNKKLLSPVTQVRSLRGAECG